MVNGCLWFTPAPPHRQSLPSVYGKRLPLVYPCSPPQTKPTICVWQTAASGLLLLPPPPTDKAYHLCMVNGCLWFTPAPPHRQSLPSVYGKRLPLVYSCSPPQTKPTICVWQTAASGLLLLPPTDKTYHLCMANGCLWFTPAPTPPPPHRQSLPSVYGKRLPLVYSCPHPPPPTDKAYHLCMVNGCLWFTPAPTPPPPHRQSLPSVYGKRLPLVYSCSPPQTKPTICVW